jgi:hypothetical protein
MGHYENSVGYFIKKEQKSTINLSSPFLFTVNTIGLFPSKNKLAASTPPVSNPPGLPRRSIKNAVAPFFF